ncbi:hypothetical protein [Thioalkalivibrio sp. ALE28]|uniref:hypothetical protein n=1 Tax=Thioalkalivibrio sp. ALE28 TaxID=1158179 RepID=UPI0012DE36CD|nr:hypothetical protein [Thioalkalivibrio sp. ALE28]
MDVRENRNSIEVRIEAIERRTAHSLAVQFLHDIQPMRLSADEEPQETLIRRDDVHVTLIFVFRDRAHIEPFRNALSAQVGMLRNKLASASARDKKQLRRSIEKMTVDGLPANDNYVLERPFIPKPEGEPATLKVEEPKVRFKITANLFPRRALPLPNTRRIDTEVKGWAAELPLGFTHGGGKKLDWLQPRDEVQVLEALLAALELRLQELRRDLATADFEDDG